MSTDAAEALKTPTAEEVKPASGTERQETDPTGSGEATAEAAVQRDKPEDISNPAEWLKNAPAMSERIAAEAKTAGATPQPEKTVEQPASEQPATEVRAKAPEVPAAAGAAGAAAAIEDDDGVVKDGKARIRLNRSNYKSDLDYRVAVEATQLGAKYGLMPSEAEAEARRLLKIEAPKEAASGQPAKTEPEARADGKPATAAETDARIKELTVERKKEWDANLSSERYQELDAEIASLREHKIDLKLEGQAKADREREEASRRASDEREAFDQAALLSQAEAVKQFPDCAKADSALVAEMKALDAEWEKDGHPLFHSANKPLLLAERASERIKRLAPPKAASPQPVQSSTPAQPAAPIASGSARTTPTAQPQGQLLKELNGISNPNDYAAALKKLNVPVQF